MNIGFQAVGTKEEVLESVESSAEKQRNKYRKDCKDNQVAVYDMTGLIGHKSQPLPDKTLDLVLDAVLANVNEQLSHCKATDEVSVSFQISVSRPHPELNSDYVSIPARFWDRIRNIIK